jgi:Pyridoxamine 5'-phosphate oxidase
MAAELADVARSVIDANSYMALGTADGAGNPWVSPVWFASEIPWPLAATTDENGDARPSSALIGEVGIAIFDSSVPVGGAQAVYMKGVAQELMGAELEQGLEVFDRVSRQDIGRAFGPDDVQGSALFRLYRATVSEHWVLIPGRDPDRGSGVDRSERVALD